MRKESGFEITDRICVTIPESDDNSACLRTFGEYIASQVLADKIEVGSTLAVKKV